MRARFLKRLALLAAVVALVLGGLFVFNGRSRAWRQPVIERGRGALAGGPVRTLRVFALNLAKAGFHHGGLEFASVDEVRARLDLVAAAVRAEAPDVVCLSEVVLEAGPVPLDQAAYLAEACGFARHVASENYSFGLPFYRIRSGNALLARRELRAAEVQELAGAKPFWSPTNNRRALWCELDLGDEWLVVASLRNDSFDLANNCRQTEELLAHLGGRPALLAGDFNAEPADESFALLAASGLFTPRIEAPPTYPAHVPARRIDNALAPVAWSLVEHHVVDTGASDHLAVVATFARP
jgi:endonuclease/exonuclease/phosphatase family metal-dependent hydrolase